MNANKLLLNIENSKFMVFHPHQKSRYVRIPNLQINNKKVELVTEFNFLGINLDQNLTWRTHTGLLKTKLNRMVGILNRLKYFLDAGTHKTLYHALFTPHINYGILCWGYSSNKIF